jgi:hypothetical protein
VASLSASMIAVRTQPGHNTLTPIGRPTIFVVLNSSSLRATTACLLAAYAGPDPGFRPAMLAVLTMCP